MDLHTSTSFIHPVSPVKLIHSYCENQRTELDENCFIKSLAKGLNVTRETFSFYQKVP